MGNSQTNQADPGNGNQTQQKEEVADQIQYQRVNGINVRVEKPASSTPLKNGGPQNQKEIQLPQQQNAGQQNLPNSKQQITNSKAPPTQRDNKDSSKEKTKEVAPKSGGRGAVLQQKLAIIREETLPQYRVSSQTPLYTDNLGPAKKKIRVYVDKDIEFTVDISNDQLTSGWLLSEVTRRYTEELNRIRKEKEEMKAQQRAVQASRTGTIEVIQGIQPHSPTQKYTKKFIVALKTTDQRESLDYWLTQNDRTLEAIEDGEFLIAHMAKLVANRKKDVDKKDFEQIKVIGRGGFSRVILVRKKDTGRLYAMKIMKKNKIIREKKLKPILSERKVLEKLKHPFIIKLHWAFQSSEELFFVMDLCTGGEIFFHLNKLKKFSEDQARFYFTEILLGIQYLHDKNVVYRDIKPENILIDIDGHIRIADFGLSKVIPQRQKSYSFCGSPEYMSPEMLQGAGHDRKVDIYCLGALLFEMLTGLPPFYNKDTNKMYDSILNHDVVYPDYLGPIVVNLMQGLLQRDPGKRYQSVAEIKKHSWFKQIVWDDIQNKRVTPPIIPDIKDCHIDPDYVELPLDFEESQYKVRLSTERRYSYYYESTLQSKSVTEQSFYNNFFEKNDSGSGAVNLLGGGSSVKSGIQNGSNPYGVSIQSEQSQQSQDSSNQGIIGQKSSSLNQQQQKQQQEQQNKNVITGLENFTFIDVPQEELEIQKLLNKMEKQLDEKRQHRNKSNDNTQQNQKANGALSIINLNSMSSPGSEKNPKLFHKHSMGGNEGTFPQPQIGEHSNTNNFTLSSKSGLTFEESSQSIAQEFRINESIATIFGPQGQIIGGTQVQGGSGVYQFKQTSLLMNSSNNRLTIQEEEDDDELQSMGGSQHDFMGSHEGAKDSDKRVKAENFSFKNITQPNYEGAGSPMKNLTDHFLPSQQTLKKDKHSMQHQNTMTTATQSSQYHNTQQNYYVHSGGAGGGQTEFTTSQYTDQVEPTPRTSNAAMSNSGMKMGNVVNPQFGRSGSQTNNLTNQGINSGTSGIQCYSPIFAQQRSVPVKDGFEVIDTTLLAMSPKQQSQQQKTDRKSTDNHIPVQTLASSKKTQPQPGKKKSVSKQPMPKNIATSPDRTPTSFSYNLGAVDQKQQQEQSFSRIPSMGPQQWATAVQPGGAERPTTSQQNVPAVVGSSQANKKPGHKHKPSYSLSPSNILAAQATYQQLSQQTQQISLQTSQSISNTKQSPLAQQNLQVTKKVAIKDNKAQGTKPLVAPKKTNILKPATQPLQGANQQGIKSFLKAALPLTQQIPQKIEANDNEDNLNPAHDTSNEQITIKDQTDNALGKKTTQQLRVQKFRSMDMTQNLLKKTPGGAKTNALKNNLGWKQHMLQIQTSQSPSKEQTGISQAMTANQLTDEKQNQVVNTSQVTINSQTGASSNNNVNNNKQSIMSNSGANPAIQNSTSKVVHTTNALDIQMLSSLQKPNSAQPSAQNTLKKNNVNANNKTPERKESNLSIDQLSTVSNPTSTQNSNPPYPTQQHQQVQSTKAVSTNPNLIKRQSNGSQKQNILGGQPLSASNAIQQNAQLTNPLKPQASNHATNASAVSATQSVGSVSVNQAQTPVSNSQQQQLTNSSLFSTPKGSKGTQPPQVNSTAVSNNPNGFNSQRGPNPTSQPLQGTISTVTPQVSSTKSSNSKPISAIGGVGSTQMKTLGGGLSRNETNQKKSNTAQAALNNKFKKI